VKAWHENKGHFRQSPYEFRAHLNDLAGFWPFWQVFVGLALNFTGMASNTFFDILKQVIFTHSNPPAL
jgi:hypothetical protein